MTAGGAGAGLGAGARAGLGVGTGQGLEGFGLLPFLSAVKGAREGCEENGMNFKNCRFLLVTFDDPSTFTRKLL